VIRFPAFIYALVTASVALAQPSEDEVAKATKRATEIGDSLKRPERIAAEPEKHLDTLRAFVGLRESIENIKKTHGDGIKTAKGQGPYHKLDNAVRYAEREIAEYDRYAKLYASKAGIDEEFQRIQQSTKLGLENKSIGFFKPEGDVAKSLANARMKLAALEALDPKSKDIAPARESIEKAAGELKSIQTSMRKELIEANAPPPDEYRKADREKLIERINEAWSKGGTKETVLKVGIVSAEWTRSFAWQKVGSEWLLSDRSRIQGYVIVAKDDAIAVRHSINLTKDHLAEDAISLSFLNDPIAEPDLANQIVRNKVK